MKKKKIELNEYLKIKYCYKRAGTLQFCPTNNLGQKKQKTKIKSFTQDNSTKKEQSLCSKLRVLKTEHLKKNSKLEQIISRTKVTNFFESD